MGGSGGHQSGDMVKNYIPTLRFNGITLFVVIITLTIGILIPDIELVLGLVGSTIGSVITLIFPSLIFIKLTEKNTTERLIAQIICVYGIGIMILGTYGNLHEADKAIAISNIEPFVNKPVNLDHIEN